MAQKERSSRKGQAPRSRPQGGAEPPRDARPRRPSGAGEANAGTDAPGPRRSGPARLAPHASEGQEDNPHRHRAPASREAADAAALRVEEERIDAPAGAVIVREAGDADVERLVDFEVDIARISFPRDAVLDRGVHEKKLRKAIERREPGMIVLARSDGVVGWLWISVNTNFLTGERYATFRSMAVDEREPDSPALAQILFDYGIACARGLGLKEVTGKVHVDNVRMRLLYRHAGFESEHLTMKLYLDA